MRHITASFIRGGTSRGLFFNLADLPAQPARDQLLARLMGSPDPFAAQIDGMGGATSSTSKVAIISPSSLPSTDIDFLFGQVDVRTGRVDYSGSCGNMIVGAGLYALLNGLGPREEVRQGWGDVRIRQVNTGKDVVVSLPCSNHKKYLLDKQPFSLQGVPFPQPQLRVKYLRPGKAPHSSIFSQNEVTSRLEHRGKTYEASLVEVSNPTIFMRAADLGLEGNELKLNEEKLGLLEELRCLWAVRMGYGDSPEFIARERPSVPKIAFLSKAEPYTCSSGELIKDH